MSRRFESLRPDFNGSIEFDFPLSKISYYRIGGPASVLITPKTISDLEKVSQLIAQTHSRFFILGWGSNLLFSDQGFPGVVIRMKSLFTQIKELSENELEVGASVGASTLLKQAQEKGFGGLERLTGIPGSMGGIVAMNGGTHLGSVEDLVQRIETVKIGDPATESLPFRIHEARKLQFSYRQNHFLIPGELITRIWLKVERRDPAQVKLEIDELYQRRKKSQPVDYPSCGSVFKNPKGRSGEQGEGWNAWQVVDELGLRGHRIGNAQFSEKHSNFIVNLGGATSEDVKALIRLAQSRAKSELGIDLETEVKMVE